MDLVGSAILGDGSLAVVKLNVIEYANNEAKIYENRVIEIEELTVVGGVGHPKIGDSTSPAVSSEYIISAYRDFVNSKKTLGSEGRRDRFSYAGEHADNADLDALAQAKELQDAGVAEETIRRQTGWFRGMDGKWRWEIDDSAMEYHRAGDAQFTQDHPEYARQQELMQKFFNGELTVGEEHELRQLNEIWGREYGRLSERVASGNATLENLIRHSELFDAYPQLRKTRVVFAEMEPGTHGSYNSKSNVITLSEDIRNAPEDTLVHEVQHAIQNAEGFTPGASTEFWKQQRADIIETIRGARVNLDLWLNDIGYEEQMKASLLEVSRKEKTLDQHWEDMQALKDNSRHAEQIRACEEELAEYQRQYDEITGGMTPSEQYQNTAGEIEARDVAQRRNLTTTERKNNRPDIDRSDVVFAENNVGYGLSKDEHDSVKDQLREHQAELNAMNPVAYIQDDGWRNMSTGQFRNKIVSDLGKTGFRVERKGFGVIEFSEKELNKSLNYMRTDAETAAYQALSQVLKRGIEISGHGNHKGRGYETVTIAAPVLLNGERANMAVVVMQTKGNRYKVHRVLTPNGEAVILPEMANAEPNTARRITEGADSSGGTGQAINSASNNTILQSEKSVKGQIGKRYSFDDTSDYYETHDYPEGNADYGKVMEEMGAKAASEQNAIRRQEERKQDQKVERERTAQKRQEAQAKTRTERQQRERIARQEIKSQMAKAGKPYNESKPQIAKKEFRSAVLKMFSIPEGSRAELGNLIDSVADRLIKKGSLTETDRKNLLDRLYESGVMTVPAEEIYRDFRGYTQGGRMYVPERIVAEFGDDWNDIRRRAFSVGIYLVRDQSKGASGIDVWNNDLAGALPGLFDSEETDLRSILERIIQVAEEGKDEKMSLPEYARWLEGKEGSTENEFLDSMERQFEWALKTFAEKAQLEIKLRDREGMIVAREREKASEARYMDAYREQQRRAREREARKESAQRQKARKELQELQQRTLKTLQWLSKNRNRAPEELRSAWDEVLGDIDLYAVSAADEMRWSNKYNATWQDLAQMYKDAQTNDPNFMPSKELERIVTRLDGTKIADMDLGALQDLYKAAIGLRTEFYNRNNVINDEMQRLFAEVYTDAKGEIESAPGGYTGKGLDKLMNLQQLTPMNLLQRMGGWDPDGTFYSMAKQLERGERDMRAYTVKAKRMLETFLNEHKEWAQKADGQGKDGIWYEIEVPELLELHMGDKPIFGDTVKVYLTPAQKVHMYLESKNVDNLRHMTGGRTFADKELYSQGKRQEALSQGKTIRLAPETVRQIVSDLTAEELELANILDQYYNSFAPGEINRVSNILHGYDKAMGKNYAPIYTNQNYTKTEFGVFDVTAEGVGNLKGRQYAVNPSYNISAFEAFERHVDQTARFCGMAIPARNWTTLMNWREQGNSTGDVITHKWGEESKRYITDLITTLQGGDDIKTDVVSGTLNKIMSNYISAVFGANPSIVLKQLGSIPLAGAYLDFRNFPNLSQIRGIDRSLIGQYTQDLEWRTMGYSMPETKQLKDNPNWTQTNKAFKLLFGGDAITAMDGWAASVLWPWAENKVRQEHPELEMGTKEQISKGESAFYKKVAEEFENAVARSQSTSDEIHQGALRKSGNPLARAFTLFRSDSAQTYNTIRQKIGEAQYYIRTGATEQVVRTAKKAAGAAFCAMLLNAAWSEAVTFLMALWKHKDKRYRDDEEELTAGSVAGEMVSGMVGSLFGTVTGGEELYEIIGAIVTDEQWYGFETPGMEQLTEMVEVVIDSGSDLKKLFAGATDVVKNGGDLGQYLGENTEVLLGGIKNIATAFATYLPGLPVSNVEAYLMGAVKTFVPEWGTAYDDLFQNVNKGDLSGLEGDSLEYRLGEILKERNITQSDDTIAALAALYQEGYRGAVPGDIPSSVSVNGEDQTLGAYQQQAYGNIWSSVVAEGLDDLVSSQVFADGDTAAQEKMLGKLYDYAAEQAKAALFDDNELAESVLENAQIIQAGTSVAVCMIWNAMTGKIGERPAMTSSEKAAWLAELDLLEAAKEAIFQYKITESKAEAIAAVREVGLSFDQFLEAYAKYSEINGMDATASVKAAHFANWVGKQGYSENQAATVREQLKFYSMSPASSTQYDDLLDRGLDPDDALDLLEDYNAALGEIELEDDQTSLSDFQKWQAAVDYFSDADDQLAALSMSMTDSQMVKADLANDNGIKPRTYIDYLESRMEYDGDGNGTLTQEEVRAALDAMGGLSIAQRAILWQLSNKSWKAASNPYDASVGQEIVDSWEEAG